MNNIKEIIFTNIKQDGGGEGNNDDTYENEFDEVESNEDESNEDESNTENEEKSTEKESINFQSSVINTGNNNLQSNKINIIKLNESPELSNDNNSTIVFEKNENSNNNEEEVIFTNNNNSGENISKFIENSNKEVILEQEVFIKEEDRIYTDDIIYLTEIQNQILSSYPVSKQGLKYIQDNAEVLAKEIINITNEGNQKYILLKNNIKYKLIYDYIENNYSSKWIIPIVNDKHKVYANLKENDSIEENEDLSDSLFKDDYFFTESLEDTRGIIEENQRIQHIKLKEIEHQKALGKINYKNYIKDVNNIVVPYTENDTHIGYLTYPKNSNLVLRYFDMDNLVWNTRKVRDSITISTDILDENKKIKGIEQKPFIPAENINIVGFMIIPFGGQNMENFIDKSKIFTPDNYNNYLNKPFFKVGDITRIYSNQDNVIIDIENHNLKDGQKIYIDNTNSFPNINNVYQKSVKVIDKNSISIKLNTKIIDEGSLGVIYKTPELEYDLYDVVNGNNDYNLNYVNSNYEDKTQNDKHNKVYLFNNIKINSKDEMKNIINKIFPTLDNIISLEKDNLSNCYTIEHVNELLKKYNITINDLFYQQIDIIKSILTTNMNKIIEKTKSDKKDNLVFHLSDQKIFSDSDYYLSNEYINHPNIIKYYGKYIHFGLPEDCIELRLKWVQSQKDLGEIFFMNFLLLKNEKNKNMLKYISEKKSEINKEFDDVNKNFKKEEGISKREKKYFTYQPYIVTKKDIDEEFKKMKKDLPNDSTIFLDGNIFHWKNGKQEIMKDVPDNTFALVGEDLWVCKKDVWQISNMKPSYDSIIKICMLDNIDILNITLDDLEYLIHKDTTCKSKSLLRIEDKYKLLEDIKNKYSLLEEYYKNNEFIKKIELKMTATIKKYYTINFENSANNKLLKNNANEVIEERSIQVIKSEDKHTEDVEDELTENITYKPNKISNKKDKLEYLLNAIYKIKNEYIQQNLIYDVIDKDGILIGKDIYSKKYKRKMNICGHNIYFKNATNSNDVNVKTQILKNMLVEYSDNGESEKNMHVCVNCGETLLQNDFDDTEGFSDKGMILRSRFIWNEESTDDIQEEKDLSNISALYQEDELKIDCNDNKFKEVLLNNGLSIENIEEASKICNFITSNLYPRSGVYFSNKQLITIIIECIQKFNEIFDYKTFIIKEISRLKKTGENIALSNSKIDEIISKKIFEEKYVNFKKYRKFCIILARFLITIQTSIPEPKRFSSTSVCPFSSFNGDEGINFMACILKELMLTKTKNDTVDLLRQNIIESYNDFKKSIGIRTLYKERKIYDIDVQKKKDYYKYIITNENEEIVEVPPLDKDFKLKVFKSKDIEENKKLIDTYFKRYKYVIKKMKQIIRNVIANSNLTEPYIGLPELSCCLQTAEEYDNYYKYIELNSDEKILDLIEESNLLFEYSKLFLTYGVFSRIYFEDKYKMINIFNNFNIDEVDNTDEAIIKIMFDTYVDSGIYKGTRREYIGTGDNIYDLKSGKTKKEILSQEYTLNQYKQLLNDIEFVNKKIYYPDEKPINKLESLKQKYESSLESEINNLIRNIGNVLNKKDKEFETKYKNLLRNMGIFKDMNMAYKKNSVMENKKNTHKEKYRFDYLKKVYIQYILRYVSMIKNDINKKKEEYNLDFAQEAIAKELQMDIYNYYTIFDKFFEEKVQKYFSNINFDYSINDIQSIFANDNLYNFKYSEIKSYSNFTFNDAGNVMLYIIVNQLNKMISCKISKEDDDLIKDSEDEDDDLISKIDMKTVRCKYICEFIMTIFSLVEEDYEMFEICGYQTNKFKNNFIHEIISYRAKQFIQDDDSDYFAKMIGKISSKPYKESSDEFEEKVDKEQQEITQTLELDDKLDEMKNKYTQKHGVAPTAEMLDEFKEAIISGDQGGDDPEVFDPSADAKGDEVLDQGAGYSGFTDFDFETGDGFDYSGEA
jgi:hypothetical protein